MIYLLYRYGLWSGLTVIMVAVFWDLATKGITCLFAYDKYSICWKGTLAIIGGLILVLLNIWAANKVVVGKLYSCKHIPDGRLK